MDQSLLIFWTATTGILSALATGLGAIPVHFLKTESKTVRAFASAVAAGMMISASVFSLAQEGIGLKDKIPSAPYIVILGLMLGAAFFRFSEKHYHPRKGHSHLGVMTKRSEMIILAMFIHSIPEGIAIGVAFATGNFQFGLVMALAISVHNIPEGIAVSLPLKADGASTKKCALISILTSLPLADRTRLCRRCNDLFNRRGIDSRRPRARRKAADSLGRYDRPLRHAPNDHPFKHHSFLQPNTIKKDPL